MILLFNFFTYFISSKLVSETCFIFYGYRNFFFVVKVMFFFKFANHVPT